MSGAASTGVRTVPYALLSRDLRFKVQAMVDVVDALTQLAVTLVLAFAGAGYWALALGNVAARVAGTVVAVAACPHPVRWPWPLSPIASAIRFGGEVVLSRVVWYAYSSADMAIIGRVLGAGPLGSYSLAASIASVPISKIYALYYKATSPVFSAAQHDPGALRRYLLQMLEAIALLACPLSLGVAVVAGPFVSVVLGPRWTPAVLPLQLLAVAAVTRWLDPIMAQILISTGRANDTTRVSAFAALLLPLGFLVGTRWGIAGVAAVWLVGHPVVVLMHQIVLVERVVGRFRREFLAALWPALSGVGAMVPAVLLALHIAQRQSAAAQLALGVAVGACTYVGVLLLLHRARLTAIMNMIRRSRS